MAKVPGILFPGWTLLTDWVSIVCLPEGQEKKLSEKAGLTRGLTRCRKQYGIVPRS